MAGDAPKPSADPFSGLTRRERREAERAIEVAAELAAMRDAAARSTATAPRLTTTSSTPATHVSAQPGAVRAGTPDWVNRTATSPSAAAARTTAPRTVATPPVPAAWSSPAAPHAASHPSTGHASTSHASTSHPGAGHAGTSHPGTTRPSAPRSVTTRPGTSNPAPTPATQPRDVVGTRPAAPAVSRPVAATPVVAAPVAAVPVAAAPVAVTPVAVTPVVETAPVAAVTASFVASARAKAPTAPVGLPAQKSENLDSGAIPLAADPALHRPARAKAAAPARESVPTTSGALSQLEERMRPHTHRGRVVVRVGVLGALALVTLVVPLSKGAVAGGQVLSGVTLETGALPTTVSALSSLPDAIAPPPSLAAADTSILAARGTDLTSRSAVREVLPGCDPTVKAAGENGQLDSGDLCTLWDGHLQMRADAATALAELNQVYIARFGANMCLSSGYRTLAQQYALKAQKGGLAATPGKSNHGWGLAIDFCSSMTSGERWTWLKENGPTYGFVNPNWALSGGSGPHEPWHWEYIKGVMADGEFYG
ncbi:M15 family metallopeptidase [Cellulomonas composti]|uniref:D-alanyl-D-alanine carboxypeptidase-like core domain-containing protein n=1 Tax=Cellulomonas composti TaxID=266130 RepID=A0A511JBU5_9CELL|nr:M15 family metallopeptidase [Cellulomonas composti]GEL95461.1 hypothetical protein CCO02nite_21190 [Cellulomonas composti]